MYVLLQPTLYNVHVLRYYRVSEIIDTATFNKLCIVYSLAIDDVVVIVILALLVQAEVPVYTEDNAIEIPVCESI